MMKINNFTICIFFSWKKRNPVLWSILKATKKYTAKTWNPSPLHKECHKWQCWFNIVENGSWKNEMSWLFLIECVNWQKVYPRKGHKKRQRGNAKKSPSFIIWFVVVCLFFVSVRCSRTLLQIETSLVLDIKELYLCYSILSINTN